MRAQINHRVARLLITGRGIFFLRAEDQRAELNVHFHRVEKKMMTTKMKKDAKDAKRSAKS